MLADTTAVYALGHFFVSNRSTQHQLMALWAPLLLVHLGGQDNITAYAVEDNRLWLRHLQNLGVQVMAAAYVVYQSSVLSGPAWLRAAIILIFVVGVLKYGERVWALNRASSVHSGDLLWLDHEGSEEAEDVMYQKENVDKVYHKIQMHLSKMYSVLYTKAVVMCSWQGICIRVISSLATLAAFILFHLFSDKDGYNRVDVAATYILLVGAGVLEITSVLRLIFSTWAMQGMMRSNRSWCKAIGLRLGSDVHTMYWSGSMGQLDLLYLCRRMRDVDSRSRKIMRWMGWCGRWWIKRDFSWSIPVPIEIIEMLMHADQELHRDHRDVLGGVRFEEEIARAIEEMRLEQDRIQVEIERKIIRGNQKSEENTIMRQEMEIRKKERLEELMKMIKHRLDQSELRFLGIGTMGFAVEMERLLRDNKNLEQNILIWHIATDAYLKWYMRQQVQDPRDRVNAYLKWYKQQQVVQDPKVNGLAKATEALSNYMIYLLAAHPLRPNGSPSQRACSFYNRVNHHLEHIPIDDRSWMEVHEENESIFETGSKLGKKLIDTGNQGVFVESIAHLWVHLLKTVEDQLGEDFHVKQLSNGSEFLTVLSILVKYTQPAAEWRQEDLPRTRSPPPLFRSTPFSQVNEIV
uniref:Uncharacterized protein n=1 Tax=Avena sativa TaxID=4498 RepID=A0ACD5YEC4_AVESA